MLTPVYTSCLIEPAIFYNLRHGSFQMLTLVQMHELIAAARAVDSFSHRGQIGVAVRKGKFQVQRVTFAANGKATITHKSKFVPPELLALNLNAEVRFGAL